MGLPVASAAAIHNATDAAWSAYEAAWRNFYSNEQAYLEFEAAIPIGPRPEYDEFGDREEWDRRHNAWRSERAKHPVNPFNSDDAQLDALCEPITAAEDAIFAAPATTVTDIERKLAVISQWGNSDHSIEVEMIDGILADVREFNRAA